MEKIDRRELLKTLAAAPAAAGLAWTDAEAGRAGELARAARREAGQAGTPYAPRFFTAHELAALTLLVDIIIPADARSGSASDAGVPEFIDFMMIDQPARQVAMRGGLAWLDHECRDRFGRTFLESSAAERLQVVDDIAWPAAARPEMSHGAGFFSIVRDLTATGFFTSRMGIDDLGYQGNVYVARWNGAPKEALDHLGVSDAGIARWYTGGGR